MALQKFKSFIRDRQGNILTQAEGNGPLIFLLSFYMIDTDPTFVSYYTAHLT
jgi:hypothetical protein